jgi:hypothetical protein
METGVDRSAAKKSRGLRTQSAPLPGSDAPARNMQDDAIGQPRAIHAREPSASGFPLPKACQNRSSGVQTAAAPPSKQVRFIEMGIRLSGS